MEQYLFSMAEPEDIAGSAEVRHNVWLLSPDEIPPLLLSPEDVGRLLGVGRAKVYDLIRYGDLRSIKVGAHRRVSAKALAEYVNGLELQDSA